MLILLLLLIIIVLSVIAFFINKKSLSHPATIISAAYIASIGCACLNIERWHINMSLKTFIILLAGYVEFVVVSTLVVRLYARKRRVSDDTTAPAKTIINVPKWLILICVIYSVVAIALQLKEVLSIASAFGDFSNIKEALTIYKNNTSYANNAQLPQYVTIIIKPICAFAYIYAYIFIRNLIMSKKGERLRAFLKYSILLLFPLLYLIQRFLESNRGSVLNMILGLIVIAIVLIEKKNRSSIRLTFKKIVACLACLVLLFVSFFLAAPLVGRINNKGMFEYITYYIGGSIECFNRWNDNPEGIEVIPGEYSFSGTIKNLNRLKLTNIRLENKRKNLFVYEGNIMVGNVYTAYRAWIHDFGYLGAAILNLIQAAFFALLYSYIMRPKTRYSNFAIIFMAYSAYTLFLHPIDGYFFLEFPTIAITATIATIYVSYRIIKFVSKIQATTPSSHYYLSELSNPDAYNASSKARIDAETIFERKGLVRLPVESRPGVFRVKLLKPLQLFSYSRNSLALYDSLCDIPSGSVIFVQYPLANNTYFVNRIIRHYQKHGLKFVALIHDYDSFRYTEAEQGKHVYRRAVFNDTKVLPLFDGIISHNASMTKVLIESGIGKSKIVDLVLFDHLTDVKPVNSRYSKNMRIDFAGNLSDSKSAFLYNMPKEIEKILNLYGNGLSKEKHCGAKYYGPFVAEKAALNLKGAFGLVWDGESADTCSGKFGEYLKINNPLKLSMYLSCGMPVIVWKKAALASYVEKHGLGIAISSLNEIPDLLSNMPKDDYLAIVERIRPVQSQISSGKYLGAAIDSSLRLCDGANGKK